MVKYLKEQNPAVQGILADPVGSTMGGGEHGDYDIEGIGNDFIADTMDMSLVDQVVKITDAEAFDGARELARKEGIFAPVLPPARRWQQPRSSRLRGIAAIL